MTSLFISFNAERWIFLSKFAQCDTHFFLVILVDRMRREFNVEANIGKPQVSYRERITKSCEIEGKFVRQSGGRGQFGHCWIRFAPADEGQEGLQFVNEVVGGVVPKEYIPAIQKGIEEQMKNGVVAGYPLIGLHAVAGLGHHYLIKDNTLLRMLPRHS